MLSKVKQTNPSKTSLASCILGLGFVLFNIAPAQAISFNWSFSNFVGGISGTVAGTLEVPEGNNVAATSVILTSTTNPLFNSLVGVDFVTFPNFSNRFNVTGGKITASLFGTDYFNSSTNLSLELNSEQFGDADSQNLALLTIAGNPLPSSIGGGDVCTSQCLQTAALFGDNTGQTQFAPTFTLIPEASPAVGLLGLFGLMGMKEIRKVIRR